MSEDPIEGFIEKNRSEFDDRKLPDGLWESIESQLPEPKINERMVPLRAVLQIAAGVAVLIGFTFWALFFTSGGEQGLTADSPKDQTEDVFDEYPEFAETAVYYQRRLEDVQLELATYSLSASNFESMQVLDEELLLLQSDLGEGADPAMIIEKMMQIYQLKLQTLESMLEQLRNNERHERSRDEIVVVAI